MLYEVITIITVVNLPFTSLEQHPCPVVELQIKLIALQHDCFFLRTQNVVRFPRNIRGLIIPRVRITSYNVCYTKLLRPISGGLPGGA